MELFAMTRNVTTATSSSSPSHSHDNSRSHSRSGSTPRKDNLLAAGFRKSRRRQLEQSTTKMSIPTINVSSDNSNNLDTISADTSLPLPKSPKNGLENALQQPGLGHSASNNPGQKLSSKFSLKTLFRFPSHDRFGASQVENGDQQPPHEMRNPVAPLTSSNHDHGDGGKGTDSPQPSLLPKRQPSKRSEQVQLMYKQFRREKNSSEEKSSLNPGQGFSSLSKQESKMTNEGLSTSGLDHFRSSDTNNLTCTASNMNKSTAFSYYEDGSDFKIQNNSQLLLKPALGGLQRGIALDRIPELQEGDSEEIDSFHPQIWKKNSKVTIQDNQPPGPKQSTIIPGVSAVTKTDSNAFQTVKLEDAPPSSGPAVRHIRSSNNMSDVNPMSPNPSLEMRVKSSKSGKSSHSLVLHMAPDPRPEWRGHRDAILQVLKNAAFLLDAFDQQYRKTHSAQQSDLSGSDSDKEEDYADEEFQTARLWDDSSSLGPDSIQFSRLVLALTWKDFERKAISIAGSLEAYREMKARLPADHAQRPPELELLILAECNLVQVKSLFSQIDLPQKTKPGAMANDSVQIAAHKKDTGKSATDKKVITPRQHAKPVVGGKSAKRPSSEALDTIPGDESNLGPGDRAGTVPHEPKLQRASSDASGDSDDIVDSHQADSMSWFKKEPTKKTTTPLSMSEKYKGYAKMIDLIE